MTQSKHVVIWDQPGEPPVTSATTVFWNEFFSPSLRDNKISLPQYVEDHSDDLRQRFLAFVRKVGETQLADKSTIEHLRILPGFSYWWMTLFACKRWSTTSNIIETVRLLALEDILREINPTTVSLATERQSVKHVIRDWCVRSGVEFNSQSTPHSSRSMRVPLSRLIPRPFKAVLVLAREIQRRFGAPKNSTQFDNSVEVVLIDYLTRFDVECAVNGEFRSGFWNDLVAVLDNAGQKTLFLHKFVADSLIPNRRSSVPILKALSSKSTKQRHLLLDARLSVSVLVKSWFTYFRLLKTRFRIRRIQHSFSPSDSQLDLWELFKDEWLDSLSGSTAILHCLTICELEESVMKFPSCRTVLYLMENQPWEMAFIQLWKKHRVEPLVGVPHSTIRYWDLRYFSDSNAFQSDLGMQPPIPHTIAVNGPAAMKSLDASGFRVEKIIEVEALAYLYLEALQSNVSVRNLTNASKRLLVLGDFFPNQNAALLAMLQSSLALINQQIAITVKPHPLCPIDRLDYPLLQFDIDTRPLAEQLRDCEMVLATNGTSASAEAYQCGLPVITILNGETFNYSPLREIPGAIFVESAARLSEALTQPTPHNFPRHSDYFRIDKLLNRWKHLLSI